MVEVHPEEVVIRDDDADLKELLLKHGGLPKEVVSAITAEELDRLRNDLRAIAESKNNTGAGGGVSVIIGRSHFRLIPTVYAAVVAGLAITASALSGNVPAIIGASLGAVQTARSLITRLGDVQFEVCTAILEIERARAEQRETRTGAAETEIASHMQQNAPGNLRDILVELSAGKGAVLKADLSAAPTRYSVAS